MTSRKTTFALSDGTPSPARDGAVVRAGEAKGVPTPVNAVLYRLVKTMEELAVIGRG